MYQSKGSNVNTPQNTTPTSLSICTGATSFYHIWTLFTTIFICYNRPPICTLPYKYFINKSLTTSTSSNLFGIYFNFYYPKWYRSSNSRSFALRFLILSITNFNTPKKITSMKTLQTLLITPPQIMLKFILPIPHSGYQIYEWVNPSTWY